jgi:ribosomal-protein-alanine N-acetyltransferase
VIHFGSGVALFPIDREHLETLRAWRNDPRIYRWCRQNVLISDADQEEWFDRQRRDSSIRMFLMREKEDGKPVGVCGLTSIDYVNRRAEFSLYTAPDLHNNGYGRNGLKTLFDYGFKTLGLNVIWGETFEGNPAARLFLKLGMKLEGVRRDFYFKEGQFIDAYLYSVLASEWCGRVSSREGMGPRDADDSGPETARERGTSH